MALDWTRFEAAETVFGLTTDPRPAWLWSGDGQRLLWRNRAAALFGARADGGTLKRFPDPRPIRGQIARIVRLGLVGRTTRSRMQFLAGNKPLSATCLCTAYHGTDDTPALLIVATDAIAQAVLEADGADTALDHLLFPAGGDYALVEPEGRIITATGLGKAAVAEAATLDVDADPRPVALESGTVALSGFAAGPDGARLFVVTPAPTETAPPGAQAPHPESLDAAAPTGAAPASPDRTSELGAPAPEPHAGAMVEPRPSEDDRQRLSVLIDRLAEDDALFGPLGAEDDTFADDGEDTADAEALSEDQEPAPDDEAEAIEPEGGAPEATLWQVTGRGFRALNAGAVVAEGTADADPGDRAASEEAESDQEPTPDAEESAEPGETEAEAEDAPAEPARGSSRYNFEELSRILTERVGRDPEPVERNARPAPDIAPRPRQAAGAGALVALSEETLLLNRLPLALLVFRDQEIVFANRAMVEMSGYTSLSDLRATGLSALIPAIEAGESVGPVHSIVRQDGERVAVEAHLQSVSWQGRTALMLSFRAVQPRRKGEPAVTAFARLMAGTMGCALVETDAAGIITAHMDTTPPLLAAAPGHEAPHDLTALVAPGARRVLAEFLGADRKAGQPRADIVLEGAEPGTEVAIFAHLGPKGDPGFIAFVRPGPQRSAPPAREPYATSSQVLGRVSRDLRRPLNTIIGFAELIGSETFGPVRNARYREYVGDIQAAGQAIAALAEEIDEYVRLFDGKMDLRPGDVDLHALLLDCVHRVRGYASAARVLLRSAVSETLPRVRVDAATVTQAVLNLLASAIALAGEGGRIVLSAHREPGGGVSIHVRDHSREPATYTEQFVVFRDGVDRNGEVRQPVLSSIGWTLTRSLAAANALTISLDPASETGTLMTLVIPPDQIVA